MADFTVITQTPEDVVDAISGQVRRVMRVAFQDEQTKVTDSVDIPISEYGADVARTLIADRLRNIRAVHALSSVE